LVVYQEKYVGLRGMMWEGNGGNFTSHTSLFVSPSNILGVKKSKWTRHVACTGERNSAYRFLLGNLEGK